MLRKWRTIIPIIVTVLGLFIGLVLYEGPSYYRSPLPPPTQGIECPFQLSQSLKAAVNSSDQPNEWVIYRHDGTTPAPTVTVTAVGNSEAKLCSLRIDAAPDQQKSGSDWRIGYILPPAALRGRQVRLTMRMHATARMELDTATIYIHDGPSGVAMAVRRIGTDPREFTLTHRVSNVATTFEVWFRLVLDNGTIRPVGESLLFTASLAEVTP